VSGLAAEGAAQVALIGEAEVGGDARELSVASGDAVERGAGSQQQAVARDRLPGVGAEDAAEVVR
jgi:hypothetical protein